jgi:hypothetical protein
MLGPPGKSNLRRAPAVYGRRNSDIRCTNPDQASSLLSLCPQVQQHAASLSLGYTSRALGNDMLVRGLPRPTVLNMAEEAIGRAAQDGTGLAAGVAPSDGLPPAPEQASSAGTFVMTVVTCCVCLTVVLAVLGHVTRSRSPADR